MNDSSPKRFVSSSDLAESIKPLDSASGDLARAHQLNLTKPPGSLGRIEDLGVHLAAIAGTTVPPVPEPATVAVFAGDHGVHAEGVTPWPQEVTAQMVQNFCAGGAAINVIGRANNISVSVINAGVSAELDDHKDLTNTPIRRQTGNIRIEAAMLLAEAEAALMLGYRTASSMVESGSRCLITGDMGIANTTPSAALIAAVTGLGPAELTGRGTGIDDETLAHKTQIIAEAVARIATPNAPTGLELMAEIGGLEIAALTGFCLGGASLGLPVIIDGVISLAGALVAYQIQPAVADYLLAGHRSVEPAAAAALDHLGLDPILDLNLRLGEGSGAALAYPLVRAAALIMAEMATFEATGIDDAVK